MLRERRAVLFDLDDTLYPYRQFKRSGLEAVAAHLERTHRIEARRTLALLQRAERGQTRGRELQASLERLALPAELLSDLLAVFRHHEPALTLPRASRRLLDRLRGDGWATGINTNGTEHVQRRKVAALGLEPLVDTVVYAAAWGSGRGKPEAASFLEAARRLDVPAERTIFVGNDELCDIDGALAAGMHPIYCAAWTAVPPATRARAVARRLSDVERLVPIVFEEAATAHAA
jgi:putative hydrolase of the HAD superfamily